MNAEFPSPADLIPHAGPALLIARIVAHDADATTTLAHVNPWMQYVNEGRVDAALALELMAQTVAAHVSLQSHWASGVPRAGYIVGVPKMEFFGGDYQVGQELSVVVRLIFHEGPIGRFEGEVTHERTLKAKGTLTVFEPPLAESSARGDERSR